MLIIICMCGFFQVNSVNYKALVQRTEDFIKHTVPWKRNGSDLDVQDLTLFFK